MTESGNTFDELDLFLLDQEIDDVTRKRDVAKESVRSFTKKLRALRMRRQRMALLREVISP